ncbi:hypothetical protein SBDP1_780003 [Syntrophobacter sp. SbD1]|nr:hypothetical protein SBDP1_780003 [Syntrophobacter sp. SbD1]
MKSYDNGRKREIASCAAFANAEQDFPDTLDFTGKRFFLKVPFCFSDLDGHSV